MGKHFKGRVELLKYFIRHSWLYFILTIVFATAMNFFKVYNPKLIGEIVDHVILQDTTSFDVLWKSCLEVFIVGVLSAVCLYLHKYFNAKASETLVETMRNDLYEKILRLPYAWHLENHTGDIIQRCTSDVDMIKSFLSLQLTNMINTVLFIVLILVFMTRMSIQLALISYVFIPLILLSSILFYRKVGSRFELADEEEGVLSSVAQENLTCVKVVRAFGREIYEEETFQKQNERFSNHLSKLIKTLCLYWMTGDLFNYVQILIALILGSSLAMQHVITPGDLIAFLSYNAMLSWPVRSLGRQIVNFSKANISLDRLLYIMDSQEEDLETGLNVNLAGDIVFDEVSFSYGDLEVLKDVSFTIPQGSSFGVLGVTGSGKSTILSLLVGLYPLQKGRITINGYPIQDISLKCLRSNMGYVLQQPYLFSKSIYDNIVIANPKANQDMVLKMSEISSLTSTIHGFKHGYETFVGERGVSLSGGQVQRVAIAQMLIRETPFRIFDDSLSAVDATTDAKINAALASLEDDATTIMISHRISTLQHCDLIIVLEDGRVVEKGNHEELIQQEGLYQTIYHMQRGDQDGK